MQEPGNAEKRIEINYFDGINSTVQSNLAKITEISHSENYRSPVIGVLEKRRGQLSYPYGLASSEDNYGLFNFDTTSATQKGVFRISKVNSLTGIYSLNMTDEWEILTSPNAQNLVDGDFNSANVNGNLILVNYTDDNRYIKKDGVTVIESTSAGDLYNSPRSSNVAFYKGKIYLSDFLINTTRYQTSILKSSDPMGIVALLNGDYENVGVADWVIPVTDTKYFYATSGMNVYDVYRGGTKIATITISSVQETSVTATDANVVFESGFTNLLSADELWINGTFSGEKQYRWVNNSAISGSEVKQYDSFKLSGGDESPIKMFTTIGNVLMIGNNNNLATWDDYTLTSMDLGIGCVSKRGYIKLLGGLYFIHYSGVYTTSGSAPQLLSRKISRYIEGATKSGLELSAAGKKGLSVFFTIGDVTLYKDDGSIENTLDDVCIEYSIADENWYIHTNVKASQFASFIEDTGVEKLFLTDKGADKHVKEFLNKDTYTDDGLEIFSRVDTQEIPLRKNFEESSLLISVITDTRRGSSSKCMISLDDGDFYELEGKLEKGISVLKINGNNKLKGIPPIARKIKISIRDNSKQGHKISQLSLVHAPTTISKK